MSPSDTIAALSSSAFPAPRAIVRITGPAAFAIAASLAPALPTTAGAAPARLALRGMIVPATLYRFVAPRSYTGEDLIEFHIPGNPLLTQMLLEELYKHGTRPAEPGEFTARAYFNGRLDLAQAEGVAAAISAQSQRESAAARRLLAGELTRRLAPIMDSVAQTLALLEAGIDFSEEDISFLPADQANARIRRAEEELRGLLQESVRFERLAHEPTVVFAGRPNAGKSTLLNALAGHQRAVVSPVAGTTRDVIWTGVHLQRGIVRITDAAGLEDVEPRGEIALQMRQSALRAIESADVLVRVIDGADFHSPVTLPRSADLLVYTKSDLCNEPRGEFHVSARSGHGLDSLRRAVDHAAFGDASDATGTLALNSRHVAAIERALESLAHARSRIADSSGEELVALELREALDAIGSVAGAVTPDDVLGKIFSSFCIGK